MRHGTVHRELRPGVIPALSRRTVSLPSNNNRRNIPEHLLAIRLSISKEKTNFETIQAVTVMKNGSPSSLLRTFSLILAFTVASNALSVSGQDRRSTGEVDSTHVVSLDEMLDHVDEVVGRVEAGRGSVEWKETQSGTRTLSGYVGTIPMTAGVSPSGARTYSIPIITVDVPGGAPAVSLEYNSQSSHGAAGYSWEIG